MPTLAVGFGIALIALGLIGYIGTDMVSPTALIPAAFGLLLVILGIVARDPGKRKHAMHAAAMVGLLGLLGSGRGLTKIVPLLSGEPVDRPNAVITQAIMALLCAVFVVLCVKSFVDARRSRGAETNR
jgi:hypothetical protein